ncbi:hypothetical protein DFAR_2170002 [Desulfarculales bacterium]
MAPILGELAAEAMSAPVLCVGPETTLAEIAGLFGRRGVNRAPVVDDQGCVLGIVSRADLVRYSAGRLA